MNNNIHSITIIMPAFNEEKNLEKSVLHTFNTFRSLNLDFEIIIIDDYSHDRTPKIADTLADSHENINVFHHNENQGIGGSFKTGIAHAIKDYIMFVPIDNPLDTEDMEAYLPRMGIVDIVVGSRTERVGYSRAGHFASFFYNRILVPLLFNIGLSDVNWIQIYRRKHFTDGTLDFQDKSFFFLVEILVKAKRARLIIAEVPARMKKRLYGRPTHSNPFIMMRALAAMFKFFWIIHRREDEK